MANTKSNKTGNSSNFKKTRWNTRQMTTMALFMALGILLSFIEFPILPGTDFLKFDASYVTALTVGFSFGPAAGCLVGVLVAWIHGLFSGNIWGALMNSIIVLGFVIPAAIAYKRDKGTVSVIIGLVISCACMVAVAIITNLIVTPIYLTGTVDAVIALLPVLIPFNIIKSVINAILAFILIRSLKTFLHS
jgi:riboflavin transporter FmnP